jgi:hypothetical protein
MTVLLWMIEGLAGGAVAGGVGTFIGNWLSSKIW